MTDACFALAMLLSPFWALALGGAVARLCPRYFDVIADRIDPHSAHRAVLDGYDHNQSTTNSDSSPITPNLNPGLESASHTGATS